MLRDVQSPIWRKSGEDGLRNPIQREDSGMDSSTHIFEREPVGATSRRKVLHEFLVDEKIGRGWLVESRPFFLALTHPGLLGPRQIHRG